MSSEIILIYLSVYVESAYHIAKEFAGRKKKRVVGKKFVVMSNADFLVVIEACFPLPV